MCIIWAKWPRSTAAEDALLRKMAEGATLKVHRELDGSKVHRLHPLSGPVQTVDDDAVWGLKRRGLIESNMKFPVATYLLTEKGRRATGVVQR